MKKYIYTIFLFLIFGCDNNQVSDTILATPEFIQYESWHLSSIPIDEKSNDIYSELNRVKLAYYNPDNNIRANHFWPGEYNDNTYMEILSVDLIKKTTQNYVSVDSVWAGITAYMGYENFDQSNNEYIVIWLSGSNLQLSIDLGIISEDINKDKRLNSEDKPEAGFDVGNGILDDGEDIGLDGCVDEYENGWGSCIECDTTYSEYLALGETILINTSTEIDPSDPNGDNWSFNKKVKDYLHYNGTENNGKIDTEDINYNYYLDRINNYWTVTLSIDDSTYITDEIIDENGNLWKYLKIPFSEFNYVPTSASLDWNYIELIRFRFSEIETNSSIQIVYIDFE